MGWLLDSMNKRRAGAVRYREYCSYLTYGPCRSGRRRDCESSRYAVRGRGPQAAGSYRRSDPARGSKRRGLAEEFVTLVGCLIAVSEDITAVSRRIKDTSSAKNSL